MHSVGDASPSVRSPDNEPTHPHHFRDTVTGHDTHAPLKNALSNAWWTGGRSRVAITAAVAYSLVLELLAATPDPTATTTSAPAVRQLGTAVFSVPVNLRNVLHLPIYGFLGVLWFWALSRIRGTSRTMVATAVASAIGLLTELSQLPMATRVFSAADLASNLVGASAGVLAASALAAERLRRIG